MEKLVSERLGRVSLRNIAAYLLVVSEYLDLPSRADEKILASEIEAAGIRWRARRKTRNRVSRSMFVGIATRWLQFLGRWKANPPTHGFVEHIAAYSDHMQVERGLAPATAFNRCWTMGNFLPRLDVPLEALTISKLDGFVSEKFSEGAYARVTVQAYVGVLRDFFRFAERQGWCQSGLAAALRGPRIFPQEGLPKGPSWEVVQQLVASCEGDEPVNVRNKAILLLLSVYGLRAGEIIRLKLDDIDWKKDLITIQRSKNHRRLTFPLCQSVGLAISEHISWYGQIRAIPFKRSPRPELTYLEKSEIDALLQNPDRRTAQGRRDHAILLFLYNSGARASEVATVQIGDLDLHHKERGSVLIHGKGGKIRRCPLWARTVDALKPLIHKRPEAEHVFLNRRGKPLTRYGIHGLVERHVKRVAKSNAAMAKKQVSPHTIRHTTATHLLRAGVDINTIRAWLSHVCLSTTNIYAEVDLEMKAKALAACEIQGDPKAPSWHDDGDLMESLRCRTAKGNHDTN